MSSLAETKLSFPKGADVVVPLFKLQWSTRAVFEGVAARYGPRTLHVIAPPGTAAEVEAAADAEQWAVPSLVVHNEDTFFVDRLGLTKYDLAQVLDLEASLYPPGWFYQQLLKLGADEGIAGLSDAFLIWDGDLLAVDAWPAVHDDGRLAYAFLQDSSRGNADIVSRWERWIRTVLGVEPAVDPAGQSTFVPHHMWFVREHLEALRAHLAAYYDDDTTPWPALMMRSANDFGTFSEFWLYASWAQAQHPDTAPRPHPYDAFGLTTERFFEDGSAPFATAAKKHIGLKDGEPFRPSYADLIAFIEHAYADLGKPLPSSLSFEASERHRLKGRANMHVEELRSPWHTAAD
ncbi:MAG: hypothetical protein AAF797_06900 [Planctomycetota bacterium]